MGGKGKLKKQKSCGHSQADGAPGGEKVDGKGMMKRMKKKGNAYETAPKLKKGEVGP